MTPCFVAAGGTALRATDDPDRTVFHRNKASDDTLCTTTHTGVGQGASCGRSLLAGANAKRRCPAFLKRWDDDDHLGEPFDEADSDDDDRYGGYEDDDTTVGIRTGTDGYAGHPGSPDPGGTTCADQGHEEADEEQGTGAADRFGKPRFLASTSSIVGAAKSKLSSLFSWSTSELEAEEMKGAPSMIEPQPYHNTRKFKDEDILDLPYVYSRNVNMAIDRWPDNCFLRIRLVSYYPHLLNIAKTRLIRGVRQYTNLRVGNVKAMPMRKKRWCLLSSPHVDKRSKDLFEIQEHVRFLDVFPVVSRSEAVQESQEEAIKSGDAQPETEQPKSRLESSRRSDPNDPMTFKGLLMVPLPSMVSFDYWFEEVHKPVKNRCIDRLFRKRIWISKYFLHQYEKREKAEIIDKLTSDELYNEIPLRLKRHPCDYFAFQMGELRKLYDFVVARKAEDDARARYGVKRPQLLDIDEVRFVPNEEDRRCGYISSDDEDDDAEIAKQLAAMERSHNSK